MGKKIKITQPEEVRKGMEERICAEVSTVEESVGKARRLALALYHGATCLPQYRKESKQTVVKCLEECYGTKLSRIQTREELLESENADILKQVLIILFGLHEAEDLMKILELRLEGPISEALFRTPFHSLKAGDYVESIVIPTIYRWVRGSGCQVDLLEYLMNSDIVVPEDYDLANRLALQLKLKDPRIEEAVTQILNQAPEPDRRKQHGKLQPITREILQAVVRSGHRKTMDIVKRLLLDKSQPSQVREDILTALDEGSAEHFIECLELIEQEKLYRSPVYSRIVDTWMWLGFGALEPQMAQMILEDSLVYLKNPEKCFLTIDHGDMQNVHLALWALAVRNVRQVWPILWDMLHSRDTNQQINAIYFITNVQHEYLDYGITMELLEQAVATASPEKPYGEPMELISWLIPNLIPQDLEDKLPDESRDRQHCFALVERALELTGNEERMFCGKPFAWTVMKMNPEIVVEAMLRMAYISKDRSMIRAISRKFEYLTPKQRGFFYEYLLDPLHWKEDDHFLQDHQKDRSAINRQVIQTKLEKVRKEIEAKGEGLHRL